MSVVGKALQKRAWRIWMPTLETDLLRERQAASGREVLDKQQKGKVQRGNKWKLI